MNWYLQALKKYADFSGRARRKEYWYFVLFNVLISIVLAFADAAIGIKTADGDNLGLIGGLYSLAVLIPGIAVTVRRLHDTGRSGWYVLLGLIPCIGGIILLVFAVEEGHQGENEYGVNPKADEYFSLQG
ncbi:MAG TPA: DUF805 domain-containing protein [Pyrinomonadaceae bacterium]|jgi:uncharacterized membrane protein YhaH (DUF805 family)|nr:DUF805 domain-containing protein [Pyrinomonadaceae bacterium]